MSAASSSPNSITAAGNGVFFSAAVEGQGAELYFSDGSGAGTYLVCDMYPGVSSSTPTQLTIAGGRLYMVAETREEGVELHSVSGFPATVEVLGQGCGSTFPRLHSSTPVVGKNQKLTGYSGLSNGAHLLVIGLPGIPMSLPGLIASDCSIWADLALPIVVTPHPIGPRWSLELGIPSNKGLIGRKLAIQGAYAPLPLALSNGLLLTIGF